MNRIQPEALMRQQRIIMVGPSFRNAHVGGIAAAVRTLLNSNLVDKYNIVYVPTTPAHGSKWVKVVYLAKAIIVFIVNLVLINPTIVHIHTASRMSFYRKSIFVLLSRLHRAKVVLQVHGGEFHVFYKEHGKFGAAYIKNILSSVERILVLTQEWYDRVKVMAPCSDISIFANPVDCSSFLGGKLEKHIGYSNMVLFVGEICARKGVYDIITAARVIHRKYPNVVFILVGAGDVARFKEICREEDAAELIRLTGLVIGKKKIELFRTADIFVLPSMNEGLPISILEAMACGLPVVATCVGGIPQAVQDGVNGFLVEPGKPMILADKIMMLIENDKLRRSMGRESYRIARKKFDVNVISEKLSQIYTSLLFGGQHNGSNDYGIV